MVVAEAAGLDTLKLVALVRQLGASQVAESLGVDDDSLRYLVSGDLPMDENISSNLERLCEVMGESLDLEDRGDLSPASFAPSSSSSSGKAKPTAAPAADPDYDEDYDYLDGDTLPAPAGGGRSAPTVVMPPRGVQTMAEYHEERRKTLWKGRNLAVMTQFHLGLSFAEKLDMFYLVLEIELTLIMAYGDSMPEPGMNWEPERRDAEVQRRLARLRWVDRQREEAYGGMKGFIMRVLGRRRRLSGKELYQQMVDYADDMLGLSDDVELPKSLMGQVDGYLDRDQRVVGIPPRS